MSQNFKHKQEYMIKLGDLIQSEQPKSKFIQLYTEYFGDTPSTKLIKQYNANVSNVQYYEEYEESSY